jgi:haloalkane dehalogenase
MVRRRRGAIINLASVVAFQPFPHFALYAASKAFVLSFTEALAEEVKWTGVRVLALCPGAVRTELDVFAHNEGLLGKLPSLTPEEVVSAALQALAAGQVTHVVGWFNRMLVFANRLLPRAAIRWLMGVAAKPPSGRATARDASPGTSSTGTSPRARASTARDALPFHVPFELFPVEHRFLDLDGARIHYVDEGSGETLLLLHGNPAWCFLYRKIIAALKSDFRCVALDYPGYGMSDAAPGYGFTPREHSAVLERFVNYLGLQDLTLMVQDWGGPIGLGFAGRRPELVSRLIIGNTFAWPLDGELRIRVFSWVMGGPVGRVLTSAFNFVPKVFFARGFARQTAPEVRDMYLAPWRDPGRRAAAVIAPRQLVAATPYLKDVEANLHRLADRPALIVWGTQDFAFRDAERARFERVFSMHRTVLLDDASHFLQEDAGDRIAAVFRAFRSEVG